MRCGRIWTHLSSVDEVRQNLDSPFQCWWGEAESGLTFPVLMRWGRIWTHLPSVDEQRQTLDSPFQHWWGMANLDLPFQHWCSMADFELTLPALMTYGRFWLYLTSVNEVRQILALPHQRQWGKADFGLTLPALMRYDRIRNSGSTGVVTIMLPSGNVHRQIITVGV